MCHVQPYTSTNLQVESTSETQGIERALTPFSSYILSLCQCRLNFSIQHFSWLIKGKPANVSNYCLDQLLGVKKKTSDHSFTVCDLFDDLSQATVAVTFTGTRPTLCRRNNNKSANCCRKVHVEQQIQRLKCFQILTQPLPLKMAGSLNQMMTQSVPLSVTCKTQLLRKYL